MPRKVQRLEVENSLVACTFLRWARVLADIADFPRMPPANLTMLAQKSSNGARCHSSLTAPQGMQRHRYLPVAQDLRGMIAERRHRLFDCSPKPDQGSSSARPYQLSRPAQGRTRVALPRPAWGAKQERK